jgi:hypothetical protein
MHDFQLATSRSAVPPSGITINTSNKSASEEERNHLKVTEWFVHDSQRISKLLEVLIVIPDGGTALLEVASWKCTFIVHACDWEAN